MTTVYTIGHSNHPRERFAALLRGAEITALADVRSTPFSRRHPQFSKPVLAAALRQEGIAYAYLGEELGGMRKDPALLRGGAPDYDKIAATESFQHGLDRVIDGAGRHRIALMCAEREPLDCHRFLLVSRHLALRGTRINHILGDGSIEAHDDTLRRLLAKTHLDAGELFAEGTPAEAVVARAYAAGHRRLFGGRARAP
ncbi:MAG: DUF488 family protein [Dongiaceae bacterium]